MQLNETLIVLSKLAQDSTQLPSMLRELEGIDAAELSSKGWAVRFPALSRKEAPQR